MARVPLGEAGRDVTPYPFILILGQDDNERIMGDKLRDWGLAVQWNTELVGLEQKRDGVTATLEAARTAPRARSPRRGSAAATARAARCASLTASSFRARPIEHVFFVADTEVTGSMVADEVNVYLWREGFHLFFPMRGKDHWRVVGILPPELRDKDDVTFDDVIPSIRGEAGSGLSFKACTWFSTYRISHRSAARFRDRRCFLLGDAAHIHSPVGAQGMNTGLQDAYNLAWKLALVAAGKADAALLDSYEDERLPGRAAAARHDRPGVPARGFGQPAGGPAAHEDTREDRRVRAARAKRSRESRSASVSQTAIHYRESPLSESAGAAAVRGAASRRSLPVAAKLKLSRDGRRRGSVRSARRHCVSTCW